MERTTRDERSRERAREYEAQLAAARHTVAVLAQFAQAREASGAGVALEVGFAATTADDAVPPLPAAVWVALRQDDLDAVIKTLVEHATAQFVLAEHEEVDANYRLTTVAESRGLPDVDRLIAQLAEFLDVPRDVVEMVCGWGPDDPRTYAEIDRLMSQRQVSPAAAGSATGSATGLVMSSSEFAAVLSLSPEQQSVLATLVRQADIVVAADGAPSQG